VIYCKTARKFLASLDDGVVDAIITSPPYSGLPGRADTHELVTEMLVDLETVLSESGSVVLIVGSTDLHPYLPFEIAYHAIDAGPSPFIVRGMYVWDRQGTLQRSVGEQVVTHDYVIHATRTGHSPIPLQPTSSVIRTSQHGFNYGAGITTPSDLAALLVARTTNPGDFVVDPFAGLGEIGVQAVHQGRVFEGSDTEQAFVDIANARIASAIE